MGKKRHAGPLQLNRQRNAEPAHLKMILDMVLASLAFGLRFLFCQQAGPTCTCPHINYGWWRDWPDPSLILRARAEAASLQEAALVIMHDWWTKENFRKERLLFLGNIALWEKQVQNMEAFMQWAHSSLGMNTKIPNFEHSEHWMSKHWTFRTSHYFPKSNFEHVEHRKKPNSSRTSNCKFQD